MFEIHQVSVEEVLPLRQKVLRPLWTPEQCQNPEDILPLSFHLAGRFDSEIVTVASFHPQNHSLLQAKHPFRLRGMATDPSVRSRGFGGVILQDGIRRLKMNGCDLIWANARIGAIPFYLREGFLEIGELFEMPEIGLHKVMYKHLIPR